jgi:hypothetical protein
LGYRQINTGSKDGIQGGIWPAPPQSPKLYSIVHRLENVKKRTEGMGAKTIILPTMLTEGDEMPVTQDSKETAFGMGRQGARAR